MQLVQTVAPVEEPILLDDAKDFLRVLTTDDDTLIQNLISTARQQAEKLTNRQLMTATYELYSNEIVYKLPKNPIQSISSIEYMDADEVYQTLDASMYYLYEDNGVGYIAYKVLPPLIDHKKAFKATFVSGYIAVPEPIKQWMRIIISTLYENREKLVIGVSVSNINEFVDNLLYPYRVRP